MGKQTTTAATAARWRLRVHAEGAQRIKAASGLMTFDAKPDPYITFVFGGVSKQCEPVQDVEPLQYFTWPQAVAEFDVKEEASLLQGALQVHVKDSGALKDRYIGGASIPLAPLYATKQQAVLCQSKFFTLEYSDEKLKTKKDSGEVKLTISVIDTMQKAAEPPPLPAQVKEETKAIAQKNEPSAKAIAVAQESPAAVKEPVQSLLIEEKQKPQQQVVAEPPVGAPVAASIVLPPAGDDTEASRRTSIQKQPTIQVIEEVPQVQQPISQPQEPTQETPQPPLDQRKASLSVEKDLAEPPAGAGPASLRVKTLKIELVSARNLTRPTSIGAFLDRKPDPMVTLEFYGLSKTSVALKDVDLKKQVEWSNTFLAFDLSNASPPPASTRKGCGPMDLVVHVKDANLMKATYMAGGKLDLSELFQPRDATSSAWMWTPSTTEASVERVVQLTFSDEKLAKKKASGEMTLRFHFVTVPLEPEPSQLQEDVVPVIESKREQEQEPSVVVAQPIVETPEKATATPVSEAPATVTPHVAAEQPSKPTLSGDIKMLSIELLCGRDLVKPSAGNLAKSMLKSLFDRKPDPYAVLVLGAQSKKCPGVSDVDVAFFEWKGAVQVFECTSKPYPESLLIHIRDDDVAGSDPYMGGARVEMQEIWDEATARAKSTPPGDPQLVKTYPLTFTDEKMTKQKACGSVTVRFRWIYSDVELPIVSIPVVADTTVVSSSSGDAEQNVKDRKPIPTLRPRMGFVYLRKMALYNNTKLLDASLDLYIEASTFAADSQAPKDGGGHASAQISSVLTDAMKGRDDSPGAKVEWMGDELVVPICVPAQNDNNPDTWDLRIQLKDKNAIMKDTEIAFKCIRLNDYALDFANAQPLAISLEFEPSASVRKKTKTQSSIKFETEIQFIAHDSPLLSAAASLDKPHGGVVTVFLLRSVFIPSLSTSTTTTSSKDPPLTGSTFTLEIDCLATKKTKGLLSFGKSAAPDFHSAPKEAICDGYEDGKSLITWFTTCDFVVSSKQTAAAKEKETFDVVLAVKMRAGKQEKPVGNLQTNLYLTAFTASSSLTRIETIQFGSLGSMQLEFAASFRVLNDDHETLKASGKSAKPVAPHVPSGDLHLLVLCARNLVSPDTKSEHADDLDPEVRISVEPKYIKRKENPVRSMLKTKPLENAGAVPTWNEYLRLEYRLPPPPPPPAAQSAAKNTVLVEEPIKYPPPIVQLGVFDIQMPGEKNGSQVIGKVELPLSAFLLLVSAAATGDGKASAAEMEPVAMAIDVHLADKKTGILSIEGIFEPLAPDVKPPQDDPAEIYRQQCRAIGRRLRDKSKKLKSGEMMSATAATDNLLTGGKATKRGSAAGRLELHVIGFRGAKDLLSSEDRGLSAHLWLSSKVEDRRELKSKLRSTDGDDGKSECAVEWDARLTLFTNDVSAELLRSEVLTLSGKPVGSLKLPLGGLIQNSRVGHTIKEWHTLVDSVSVSTAKKATTQSKAVKAAHEILLELAFYPDQVIFDPLAIVSGVATNTSPAWVAVDCRKLIYLDNNDDQAAPGSEMACKFVLLGNTPNTSQSSVERTTYKMCEPASGAGAGAIATWNEQLKLEVGGSVMAFLTDSFAVGTLPSLRLELLKRRQGGRFQDTIATTNLSLVTLLQFAGSKANRWLRIYVGGDDTGKNNARLAAVLEIEVTVLFQVASTAAALRDEKLLAQAFEDAQPLPSIPGVVCFRFLSARNLIDVDANGEQDPYIITRVVPRSFPTTTSLPSACQTGVSLNGGRHPTWNSGIFELRVHDLVTDYVRLEVVDSNEEDHLPDASIGAIEIALSSLFRDNLCKPASGGSDVLLQQKRTRWLEAWVPIYAVNQSPANHEKGDMEENAGEVRVEFRFLTQEYYESAGRQESDALVAASPFTSATAATSEDQTARGTLYLHVVQATGLACTKGMQPGVRISSASSSANTSSCSHATKPGKQSISDPVWENEVVEIAWPPPDSLAETGKAAILQVEVVDLSVRTANANALAVVAFGRMDVSAFLTHQLAKSYHLYPLHGRKTPTITTAQSVSILIGCQFVPEGSESNATAALQSQEKRETSTHTSGSLHIKSIQAKFDLPSFFNCVPLGASLALRFKCAASSITDTKTVRIPSFPLTDLVNGDGRVELGSDDAAVLFKYNAADQLTGPSSSITPNPIVVGELVTHTGTTEAEGVVVAEFEIPIFDYVLFDGHLGSAWDTLHSLGDQSSLGQNNSNTKLGELKVEVQFLPVLESPVATASSKVDVADAGVVLLGVEIKTVMGFMASTSSSCVVAVELLGCRVETQPNIPSKVSQPLELSWEETLDLPLEMETIKKHQSSAVLKIELRAANDASTVYGTCNWIVPSDLLSTEARLSTTDSGPVVVPLEVPTSAKMDKTNKSKSPCELSFRLFRQGGAIGETKSLQMVTSGTTSSARRRGLLYALVADDGADGKSSGEVQWSAVLADASTVASAGSSGGIEKLLGSTTTTAPWIELSRTERRVLPLDDNGVPLESQCVLLRGGNDPAKTPFCTAVLDAKTLCAVVKTPATETFHRLPLQVVGKVAADTSATKVGGLACKLMYLDAQQGQLQLQLDSVRWPVSQPTSGSTCLFRLEVRLLGSSTTTTTSQRWVSSPVGTWSRKSSEITWREGKNKLTLSYTNAQETTEPVVQLVLVQIMEGENTKKEAFGQLAVLSSIATASSEFVSATTALTTISSGSTADAGLELRYKLRFVREEFSFEELEAKLAMEREATALALAEGTSKLKKAFAGMGGDEHTPIQIAELKKYVDSRDDTHARDVLQQAADVETEGDLDRLFEMMDVNGDGAISWSEYVSHIQNIHALADAGATQKQEQEQAKASAETVVDGVEEEEPEEPEERERTEEKRMHREIKEKEEEEEEEREDEEERVRAPTQPMRTSSGADEIQDVYKPVVVPSGQSTKETPRPAKQTSGEQPQRRLSRLESRRSIQEEEAKPKPDTTRRETRVERQQQPEQPRQKKQQLPLLSTYVLDWKVDEVIQWMSHEMELSQYADAIQQNAVNGKLLLTLREEELETELGITAVLHKRKVMNQIHEFQERFQYPPAPVVGIEVKPRPVKKQGMVTTTTMATASMASETPAFIKREQLVFQEKQRVKQAEANATHAPRTLGQSRVFPSKTMLVLPATQGTKTEQPRKAPTTTDDATIGETFDDAMLDIFEVVHPDSPEKRPFSEEDVAVALAPTATADLGGSQVEMLPRLPLIQIGSITNTDELFEIVRQRIHQLSQLLLPMANNLDRDTWSDFGDDPDDDEEAPPASEELTGLRLVYDAFRHSRRSASTADTVSRLKFQEGMATLLAIGVSWHQFDLLFRKLDVDGDSELCWDEFHHVFTTSHISFGRDDLLLLQDALVGFVMDRLETQQWTLSDLFKAFDRDGGGSVSIAEFATLVRFLFTSSSLVKKHHRNQKIHKRHVYLLMSCLDVSADRRISAQEFLRFFFIVWSSKLMEVQDHLLTLEATSTTSTPAAQLSDQITELRLAKKKLRRALRTNFSRPFRDAMRCLDVGVPGPFTGLLARLQLQPMTAAHQVEDPEDASTPSGGLQVWQVLRGQTNASSTSHLGPGSFTQLHASAKAQALEASRKRVQKGKNEVQRTRLTRQREPSRQDAELRTPGPHVSLDHAAKLKFDYRPV